MSQRIRALFAEHRSAVVELRSTPHVFLKTSFPKSPELYKEMLPFEGFEEKNTKNKYKNEWLAFTCTLTHSCKEKCSFSQNEAVVRWLPGNYQSAVKVRSIPLLFMLPFQSDCGHGGDVQPGMTVCL